MNKHTKNFNEFEQEIKEGITDFFSTKKLDNVLKNIFNDIKNNFDIDRLSFKHSKKGGFFYNMENGDILRLFNGFLWINNDEISKHINESTYFKIWEFFNKEYNEHEYPELKGINKKSNIDDIKKRYER